MEVYLFNWTHSEYDVLGGTDICSLFAGMCSALPVFRGEIQCRMLGMAVATFTADGKPSSKGEPGELVCLKVGPAKIKTLLLIFDVGYHGSSLSHVSPWGSGLCLATPMMHLFWQPRNDITKPTLPSMRAFGVSPPFTSNPLISAPRGTNIPLS